MPRFDLSDIYFIQTDTNKIQQRILALYTEITGRTVQKSDPAYLFLATISNAFAQMANAFDQGAKQNLLTYATGDYLDHLGVFVNTPRLQAKGAKTILQFNLTESQSGVYVIPKGTRVTDGSVVFATDELAQIQIGATTIEVNATSQTVGEESNGLAIGSINQIVDPLPFLNSVFNTTVTSGGSNIEDDEAYAARIRLAPASFSVAGPTDAYVYHALSYNSSIIDVSVYGLEDTPGIVYIHPLLVSGEIPDDGFISSLKEYLNDEKIRPLTDFLQVSAPKSIDYEINLSWYLDKEDLNKITQITEQVSKAVEDYRLWQQSKIGRDLNPDVLIEYLRKAGVKRTVITSPSYKKINQDEVAQCLSENVTISYAGFEDL